MRAMLLFLGLPDLPTGQLLTLLAMAVVWLALLAWIADAILDDGAFGVVGNLIVMTIGAAIGTLLWRKSGIQFGVHPALAALVVATCAALATLIGAATLRR